MAGLIYDLIDVLNSTLDVYNELIDLSKSKIEVIVNNDLDKLQEITMSENDLVAKIRTLEKKRITSISDIASVLNKKLEDVTIHKLAEFLKDQPEESSALDEIAQKLSSCLAKLKAANDQNGTLIKQSMDYVEFSMNAIRSSTEAEPPSYGNTGISESRSYFDKKQ